MISWQCLYSSLRGVTRCRPAGALAARVAVRWRSTPFCYKEKIYHKIREKKIDPLKLHNGKQLVDIFHTNPMVAVLHHNDWNVAEWQKFRVALAPTEIHVRVIPTKIATRALEVTKYKDVATLFRGPTCIMYCHEPKVKDLVAVIKKENKLLLLGGVLNDVLVTRNDFLEYAKLPSLEELQGQLVSQLMISSSQISMLLLKHQRDLLYILNQRGSSAINTDL